ncbi:MAG: uroporphyrinogen-III C-methyltransferase, partial [bacterium]
ASSHRGMNTPGKPPGGVSSDASSASKASAKASAAPVRGADKSKTRKQRKSAGGAFFKTLVILVLLIILAVLGYSAYWVYQNRSLLTVESDLDRQLAEQKAVIEALQGGLEAERQARIRSAAREDLGYADLANAIAAQEKRLRELGGATRTDWLLAEAQFLIRLGNQRLVIERDTANAKALLENADTILRELDEVSLMPVRQSLARDITALALMERTDYEGLYFRLSAISERIATLPLVTPLTDVPGLELPDMADDPSRVWYQMLWDRLVATVKSLGQLVRIQHHGEPVRPLLDDSSEQTVRLALVLTLEQAQVALLRQENAIYQQALEKAQQMLDRYFQMERGAAQLVEQLEELRQHSLIQAYPDISGSLEALKNHIDNRHARHTADSAGEAQ